MQKIPNDAAMLLSFVNLKLRDYCKDVESLCEELDISIEELTERLAAIDYYYDAKSNQFK